MLTVGIMKRGKAFFIERESGAIYIAYHSSIPDLKSITDFKRG